MRKLILTAAHQMLVESGTWGRFADRMRDDLQWDCSHRTALSKLSQWTDFKDPHKFPLEMSGALVEVTKLNLISPLLDRVLVRLELEQERKGPVSVGLVRRRSRA